MTDELRPPARSEALLRVLLPPRDRGAILGDLAEEFRQEVHRRGPGRARRWYRSQVLRSLQPALRRRLEAREGSRERTQTIHGGGEGKMSRAIYDVRHALRGMGRRPMFTAVVVATLALGIGTTTAVFSVVDGVLLSPLPYPDADRVYYLWEQTARGTSWVSAPNYEDWRDRLESFQDVSAMTPTGFNVAGGDGQPERISGREVTPGFFRALGVQMALGRGFTDDEGGSPSARVAVISHGLWQRRFGGSPDALGRTLELDAVSHRVVGVLPAGAEYPAGRDVWVPVDLAAAEWMRSRGNKWLNVLARLGPDTDPEAARDELAALGAALAEEYPGANGDRTVAAVPLLEHVVGDLRGPLTVLLAGVAMVLLVACVNVSGMLLARGIRRRREMAIRRSLGGSRSRLLGQFLWESLVVSLLGGGLGLALAAAELQVLRGLVPPETPRMEHVGLDGGILLFAVGVSLLAGVAAGLLPALRETAVDPREGLTTDAGSTGGAEGRWRRGLAVAQVTLAVVLAVGAGQLVQTVRNLRDVDPGFRAEGVLAVSLPLTEGRYESDLEIAAFFRELLVGVRGLPGVEEAGLTSILPQSGNEINFSFELRDPGDADRLVAGYQSVSPGYFETLSIPVVAGRPFRDGDGSGGEPVVIVDEAFAERFFPGRDPVGQEILAVGDRWRRVVGVAGSVRRRRLRTQPEPQFYVPLEQDPRDAMTLVARTGGTDPTALLSGVRRIVQRLDPAQPLVSPGALQDYVDRRLTQPRFLATVVGFFGAVTLLLAGLGIYGVVAQTVAGRLREIGIRMALGARAATVRARVVRQSVAMAGAGLLLGSLGAVPAVRALRSLLYGVSAFEWRVVTSVVAGLAVVAVAAAYAPARRATRVDPVEVLRAE